MFVAGHKNQVPGWQSQMSRQPRAFTADSVLRNLNNKVLPVSQTLLNGRRNLIPLFAPIRIKQSNIRVMDKSGSVQTNIHEGCFHPWHHPHDSTSKNIANISASVVSLNKDFLQKPVLEQGNPSLHQRDIN